VEKAKQTLLENLVAEQQKRMLCAEKEIYENITQCLCLAKLQLANVDIKDAAKTAAAIGEASLLIGKAVKDLRNLAKRLSSNH
jgi:hypothetical protein